MKADRQTILKSLQGTWRDEQLFLLKECYHSFCYYKERITVCDQEIEKQLKNFQQSTHESTQSKMPNKHANKNRLRFDTYSYLKAIHGVDVTAIYEIGDIAALEILSETGYDKVGDFKAFCFLAELMP